LFSKLCCLGQLRTSFSIGSLVGDSEEDAKVKRLSKSSSKKARSKKNSISDLKTIKYRLHVDIKETKNIMGHAKRRYF
jgi:hypothetical protein